MPFALRIPALTICLALSAPHIHAPRIVRLPAVSGPYAVGRTAFYWIDSTRVEPFARDTSLRREIMVYAWYPAAAATNQTPAPYIPHLSSIARAIGEKGMDNEFGSAKVGVSSGVVHAQAIEDAPLRQSTTQYPVLVFSHGFGESSLTYSGQLEDLASHGYVVFGIEHPYDAYGVRFPDDRVIQFAAARWDSARAHTDGAVKYQLAQIPIRAADIRFTLNRISRLNTETGNRFSRALDLRRIGAFGHSLGGIAASEACRFDARIRACMNEDADDDGRPFADGPEALPIKQPFLFFATGHSIYVSSRSPLPTAEQLVSMKLSRAQYDSITHLYQRNQDESLRSLPNGSIRIKAEADDFTHRTFIDLKVLQQADSVGVAHQTAYLILIRRYVRAFFDATLRGEGATAISASGVVDSVVTVDHFAPTRAP
jgi:predicted dienelactone hydrolase